MRRKAKEERLFQSVRAGLADKQALLGKEKSLMKGLNRVLSRMGYVAVPKDSLARPVWGPITLLLGWLVALASLLLLFS